MSDERAARIAEFIEPLRVRPGRVVDLGRDVDPRLRSGLVARHVARPVDSAAG